MLIMGVPDNYFTQSEIELFYVALTITLISIILWFMNKRY